MARTHKFCFCLPVRLGVFILTIFNLAGGLLIAVLGWSEVVHLKATRFAAANEIALVLHSMMFTVLAAISLLGFVGAVIKHRSLIAMFGTILLVFLLVSIGTGIYTIYTLFRNHGQSLVKDCLSMHLSEDGCQISTRLMQILIVIVYVLVWLFEFWGFLISLSYCHQLDDEDQEILKIMIGKPMEIDASSGQLRSRVAAIMASQEGRLPHGSEV